jgi:hypothetical protein
MRPQKREALKAGDWVVRTRDSPGWKKLCIKAGVNPYGPIKVSEVSYGDPVFYQINEDSWFAAFFDKVVNVEDRSLEDYL